MAIDYMPIGALPTLSDLSGGDLIPVAHNGVASALNAAALTRNASASAAGRMSADDKSKLDGIQAGAQVNVIEGVTVNGTAATISGKKAAITVPTKTSDIANDSDFQTGTEVQAAIDAKVSSAYKAAGSATLATLPALSAANLGMVKNITEDFITTASFVEGAGKSYPAGTNVVVALVGTNYLYDVLAGFVDLSAYAKTADMNTSLNNKVDKVTGKGLSTEDYTTAEKTKLAGIETGAEVNEVTAEDYQVIVAKTKALETQNNILKKQLENLLAGLEIPIYINASGVGVVDFEDAAAGQIRSVTVDPSLSGQKVYIQLSNSGGLTDTTGTVGSGGAVTLAAPLSTLRGHNRIYVTTVAYTFPPTSAGHGPHTGGTYVNSHTDENGRQAYDAWIPKNGIAATVRYVRDADLGDSIDREISYEEFLATVGYGVNYIQVSDPVKYHNAGAPLYIKLDGYPSATQDKPVYSRVNYPTSNAKVFYIPEYYPLTKV